MENIYPSCPHCGDLLDLVQPDLDRDTLILLVCTRCPAWFLCNSGPTGKLNDLGIGALLAAGVGSTDKGESVEKPGGKPKARGRRRPPERPPNPPESGL